MNKKLGHDAIYDARELGVPRMLLLGLQHLFAMFGATVLVPILVTGYGLPLSIQTTLLFAGIGTLLFHVCTKFKVPAFLGSSFAYLGGFSTVATMPAYEGLDPETKLAYALGGIVIAGLLYLVLALLFKVLGAKKVMRFFPPIVTGPIIIAIGLILAPSAIKNCQSNWILAFVALGVVIVCNIWGKGMVKILPILIGVLVSYAVALVTGAVDFQRISEAAWVGIPLHKEAMGLFAIDGSPEFISALFTIIPIALATMMEHVGDIAAISATVGHNYINDPGLNRTLLGDGLATTMAGLLGGRAAEEMMLGDISTGASSDIQRATAIARKMVGTYGMSSRLGNVAFDAGTDEVFIGKSMAHTRPYSEKTAAEMDAEIRAIIDEAYETCRRTLTEHIDQLHALAQALMEREKLNEQEFNTVMAGGTLPPRDGDEQPKAEPVAPVETAEPAEQAEAAEKAEDAALGEVFQPEQDAPENPEGNE